MGKSGRRRQLLRSIRLQWIAVRTLRRPVRVLRESEGAAPVIRLDHLELVLPRGRRHFRPLFRCEMCGKDIVNRTHVVRRPSDLRRLAHSGSLTRARCGTCTTSDPQQDWSHVLNWAAPPPTIEEDQGP